jgi:hypothetical protein
VTDTDAWQGRQFVLLLYVILVALTAVFGYIIGLVRPEDLDPQLFMVIDLPPTPVGMALYGALTVGVILGILLALVSYISREYGTETR